MQMTLKRRNGPDQKIRYQTIIHALRKNSDFGYNSMPESATVLYCTVVSPFLVRPNFSFQIHLHRALLI